MSVCSSRSLSRPVSLSVCLFPHHAIRVPPSIIKHTRLLPGTALSCKRRSVTWRSDPQQVPPSGGSWWGHVGRWVVISLGQTLAAYLWSAQALILLGHYLIHARYHVQQARDARRARGLCCKGTCPDLPRPTWPTRTCLDHTHSLTHSIIHSLNHSLTHNFLEILYVNI